MSDSTPTENMILQENTYQLPNQPQGYLQLQAIKRSIPEQIMGRPEICRARNSHGVSLGRLVEASNSCQSRLHLF